MLHRRHPQNTDTFDYVYQQMQSKWPLHALVLEKKMRDHGFEPLFHKQWLDSEEILPPRPAIVTVPDIPRPAPLPADDVPPVSVDKPPAKSWYQSVVEWFGW